MRSFISLILTFFIFSLFVSCRQDVSNNNAGSELNSKSKESLVISNRYLTRTEEEEIDHYIKRHQLKVEETGSGLRYAVTKHGNGSVPQRGDKVSLKYETRLISGDLIYSSDEDGLLVFQVGKGGVPSGMEEAILHLKVGDQAVIILPSHLAFGLLGDNKKIPKRATVIYKIELLKLSKNQ